MSREDTAAPVEEEHPEQEEGVAADHQLSEDEHVEEVAESDERAGPDEEESELSELEQAQARVAEVRDRMARLQAEMENLRKRTARDVENAHKFALESFSRELLTVADSMDLGLNAARETEEVASILEGMELTRKQMLGVMEKFNVEIMDAQGVRFDPEQHEAMTMVPNPEMEPNTVMDVIQKGYTLNGRLLRPARVIVSS